MKFLLLNLSILLFLNRGYTQTDTLGAIKFSYNDSLINLFPNENLFITCVSKDYNLIDTNELTISGTTKILMLKPGEYTVLIRSNSFSAIKYRHVIIENSRVTFIDLELMKRTKRCKTKRVNYKKTAPHYKNCG
jgi:hypothetical protein